MSTDHLNVTRAHLADAVCRAAGLPKSEGAAFVELFLDLISEKLMAGESVMISGFGKFVVVQRAARKGRNVKLGVDVAIEPRLAIVFKPSPSLLERLNPGRATRQDAAQAQQVTQKDWRVRA
jgi:integration host factor subunit alpha